MAQAGKSLQGRMSTGSPLLRLFGEPVADLQTGAHPHVVFRRLLLGLVSLQVHICRPLVDWISGTDGSRAREETIYCAPWGEKFGQGLRVRLRLASYTRCTTYRVPLQRYCRVGMLVATAG
jgi:hypothetical protein